MPSLTVNICALTLVLLCFQQVSQSRPHSRSERGIVKDYFVPDSLLFSSDKFEKDKDGKFYLKKSAHRADSEVKYSSAENAEGGNNVLNSEVESSEVETVAESSEKIQAESDEPLKEGITEKIEVAVAPNSPILEKTEVIKEVQSSLKIGSVEDKKLEVEKEKAPFTPMEPKFVVPPKPDSKDEISLKTDIPPVDVEEKVEEKITIGQVPDLYSRLMPVPGTFRVPIIIPVHQVSYGAVKVVPLSPADISDRLPLPPADVSDKMPFPPVEPSDRLPFAYEDDIVGEGAHESESEPVSQPIAEKKDKADRLGNPLITGMHLSTLPFQTFLKDLKETDARNSEKQAKVVDVLGKKFLMQSNVMKYPTGDNSHMYLRLLSVKPLEEVKPKEISAEESLKKTLEEAERKSMKEFEKKEEEFIAEEKKIAKKDDGKMKEEESSKEREILKAEETETQIHIEEEVPKEVIFENVDKPEMKIESKSVAEVADEVKLYKTETPAVIASHSSKGEEKSLEKTESQVIETKVDFQLKGESAIAEDEKEVEAAESDKSISGETEEKLETVDALMKKGDTGKEIDLVSKKDIFVVEKKKKFLEESEEAKSKKKIEKKKKKKCKCEEKDSDSDEDDE